MSKDPDGMPVVSTVFFGIKTLLAVTVLALIPGTVGNFIPFPFTLTQGVTVLKFGAVIVLVAVVLYYLGEYISRYLPKK